MFIPGLVTICIFGKTVSADFANYSNVEEGGDLQTLSSLHLDFCGNTTEIPIAYFPVPCCIPCFCLPHCTAIQNYCPIQTEGKLVKPNDNINRTMESLPTTENAALQSEILNGSVFSWADVLHSINRQGIQNELNTDLQNIDVPMTCVRPQWLNKFNFYLDTQAYEMIASCPGDFLDNSDSEKCLTGFQNQDLIDMIPATSLSTGISYINRNCLACNEPQTNQSLMWPPKIISARKQYVYRSILDRMSILEAFDTMSPRASNIAFEPPELRYAQPCHKLDVISCNETGLWKKYNKQFDDICKYGPSLPVVNRRKLFKNIACVHCNVDDGPHYDGYKREDGCLLPKQNPLFYSMRMNMKSIVQDGAGLQGLAYLNKSVLTLRKTRRCPTGFAFIKITVIQELEYSGGIERGEEREEKLKRTL